MAESPVDWSEVLATTEVAGLVDLALTADIGDGDVTTRSVFSTSVDASARIVARRATVVCGLALARHVFAKVDSDLRFEPAIDEGAVAEADQVVARVHGDVRGILTAERCVLNFMMRLCGIAEATRRCVEAVPAECATRIFDTRKTVPGWRKLDKAAVRVGGGDNHRMGLFDAVLIKDNHIAAAGSIREAIEQARADATPGMIVEVEIDSLTQLDEALEAKPDIVLLDNFDLRGMQQAVRRASNRVGLEASGGITIDQIPDVARTGVDRISMGSLTHTVVPADLSLEIDRSG